MPGPEFRPAGWFRSHHGISESGYCVTSASSSWPPRRPRFVAEVQRRRRDEMPHGRKRRDDADDDRRRDQQMTEAARDAFGDPRARPRNTTAHSNAPRSTRVCRADSGAMVRQEVTSLWPTEQHTDRESPGRNRDRGPTTCISLRQTRLCRLQKGRPERGDTPTGPHKLLSGLGTAPVACASPLDSKGERVRQSLKQKVGLSPSGSAFREQMGKDGLSF